MPHVFISYNRQDAWYAFKLAGALEHAGWEVWIADPTWNSPEFLPKIKAAIRQSGAVVVLMSPNSHGSDWVMQEVGYAQGAGKRLLLLLLEGEVWPPLAGDAYTDMRGRLPALPGADFFSSLGRALPRGRRHVRVLFGGGTAEPGEYAVDDASLRGGAEALVEAGRAVWIEVAAESGRKGLRVTRAFEAAQGVSVQPGLYDPDDPRLHGQKERLLKEDYAAWEEGAPVPDGPLPRPAAPFTLPLLEWCRVEAGAAHTGGAGVHAPPFHIGKYPVTNEQFQSFADSPDGYADPHWWNFSDDARRYRATHPRPPAPAFGGPKRPREMVCWYDAVAFCRWLSRKTGLSVFLPTSTQWVRAARGDEPRLYPWGDDPDPGRCNSIESDIFETTDVDRYPSGASPCGAFDMSGNVWEWSLTKYDDDDATDACGTSERREHGGSWHFKMVDAARISIRSARSLPGHYDDNIGFRLACYSLT